MSTLSQQINIYSSIGTENISSASNDTNIYNENMNQKGGFLHFLFSDDKKKKKVKKKRDTEFTEMLLNAIETRRFQVADFMMEQDFIPDFNVVNKDNQNLLHILIIFKTNMKYANHAIITIIKNNKKTDVLNKSDSNGRTPLFIAVSKGYNDIAQYMEQYGAKRISDNNDISVVTELSSVSQEYTETVLEVKNDTSRPIFNKPNVLINVDSNKIEEIIKAFLTNEPNTDNTLTMNDSSIVSVFNETNVMDNLIQSISDGQHKSIMKDLNSDKKNKSVTIDSISEKMNIPVNENTDDKKSDFNNINTEEFISNIAKRIMGDNKSPFKGGAKKNIKQKNTNISGKRKMVGYSEINSVNTESDGKMKKIKRAIKKQEKNFHNEAVNKIMSHLNKKDKNVALAIKTIIFNNISETKKELSNLDKASNLFKMINKENIDNILSQNKVLIEKIKKELKSGKKS